MTKYAIPTKAMELEDGGILRLACTQDLKVLDGWLAFIETQDIGTDQFQVQTPDLRHLWIAKDMARPSPGGRGSGDLRDDLLRGCRSKLPIASHEPFSLYSPLEIAKCVAISTVR